MNVKKISNLKAIYNYKIIEDKQLIIEAFDGDITLDFFRESMLKEFNDPKYVHLKFGVCDLRRANLLLSDSEVKQLFEFACQHDKNLKIKWATLTESPYETAMSMIFGQKAQDLYGYKIFSTIDAASQYLGIKFYESDISFKSDESR